MAIVLISPKKRQKTFFWVIIFLFVVILIAVSLFIFIPSFRSQIIDIPDSGTYATPDIKLNFNIIDSNQVKNLQPFGSIETEFSYIAKDKNGKQVVGKISEVDRDSAQKSLEQMGFIVSSLQETNVGRTDPFVPY